MTPCFGGVACVVTRFSNSKDYAETNDRRLRAVRGAGGWFNSTLVS